MRNPFLAPVVTTLAYLIAGALVLFMIFSSPDASATDLVARQGADTVRLTDKPCTNPDVVKLLNPDLVAQFFAASAVFQGHQFQACWRPIHQGAHMVYDDGDQGLVPYADLKPARDA